MLYTTPEAPPQLGSGTNPDFPPGLPPQRCDGPTWHPTRSALSGVRASGDPAAIEAKPAELQALLDEVGEGLIVCNADGDVEFANFAARVELASAAALAIDGRALRSRVADATSALAAAIRLAALAGRRQLLALGSGSQRLFITVVPLAPNLATGPRALVRLGRRNLCADLGLEMLAGMFQLTRAERRVLVDLLAGHRPGEIAVRHGVGLATVRTQATSLRAKLGAASLGELSRIAAGVASPTPLVRTLPRTLPRTRPSSCH